MEQLVDAYYYSRASPYLTLSALLSQAFAFSATPRPRDCNSKGFSAVGDSMFGRSRVSRTRLPSCQTLTPPRIALSLAEALRARRSRATACIPDELSRSKACANHPAPA